MNIHLLSVPNKHTVHQHGTGQPLRHRLQIILQEVGFLHAAIAKIERNTGRPARTIALAAQLHRSVRSMQYLLADMESAGFVLRVGVRGGWRAVSPATDWELPQAMRLVISPFEARLLETVWSVQRYTRQPVTTAMLVVLTRQPERTVRDWLNKARRRGLIERSGMRGGWWLNVPSMLK